MEKLLNFRKLAEGVKNSEGKEIKNIYRSADSSLASANDIEYLVENNILEIIDLRSQPEIDRRPVISDERVRRVHINIINDGRQNQMSQFTFDKMNDVMIELYEKDFVESDGFAVEMKHILGLDGKPFMFHCTAGKDRTGVTGAILMHILGFTKEQIIEEYLLIEEALIKYIRELNLRGFEQRQVKLTEETMKILDDTSGVKKDFIDAYLNKVDEVYENFDAYIEQKLKLTDEDRQKLKEYYLV